MNSERSALANLRLLCQAMHSRRIGLLTYVRVCNEGPDGVAACLERLRSQGDTVANAAPETRSDATPSQIVERPPIRNPAESFIAKLLAENEQSGSRCFSRSCPVCLTDSPLRRAVFNTCGHAICLACAERMRVIARRPRVVCPYCRSHSTFVPLVEQSSEVQQ